MLDDAATRFVTANGLRIACQVHGDAAAGPGASDSIVLIRGLGTQLIEWSPALIDTLVQGGLQVILLDNRDAGLTEKVDADYQLADMAADVAALMAELGHPRYHVFGISLGGMIAQLMAVNHGDQVASLISVMSSTGNLQLPRAADEVRSRLTLSASDRNGVIALETENRAVFGSPGYPESEQVRRAMSAQAFDRCFCPEGTQRQLRAALADGNRVPRLAGVRIPTLVIHGADDPLVLPQAGADTAAAIPGARYRLVAGMGHNIPDALAPEIGRRVLEFVRGVGFDENDPVGQRV
jgi:pimeloyl-ACP methyl ester carboxylesterase